MNESEFLGYLVVAIVTLGSFVSVVQKFTKPVNDLKDTINDLKTCLTILSENNDTQNKRLDLHGQEIDNLKLDVGKVKTKIDVYHKHE